MKMKRKLLSLLLALCLVLMIVPVSTFAAEEPSFGGGTGTQEDPWLITSQGDLIALAEFLNSGKAEEFDAGNNSIGNCHGYYFKQTADIDLTGVAWEPIGYSGSYYFAGNYDGDGHTISNATSTGKKDDKGHATAGIFGWVAFGSVENLHVKNANFVVTGQNEYSYVGGIAGVCYGSSIKNCSVVNSSLESKRYNDINHTGNCAGSIVGYSTGGTFEKCAAENNQVKTMAYGGVFAGDLAGADSTIVDTNCYFGACGTTDIAGTVTEKQDEDFTNGTVAGSLGDAFVQNVTEQSEVDAMATAIEDAISVLQYKDADYTKAPQPSNDSSDSNNTSTNTSTNGENTVHTHTYTSAMTKAPTTTEEGIMTYTCTTCGNVFTQPIAKIESATGTSDSSSTGQNSKPSSKNNTRNK